MPASVERALRSARRRLAAQLLLDRLIGGWVVALAVSLAWVVADPDRWRVSVALLLLASIVAAARTAYDYPPRLAAALELDSRFGLHERVTAAVGLAPEQRETPVGRAVLVDAESHAARLRVAERFPLRLTRRAWLVPLFGAALGCVVLLGHPVTGSGWSAGEPKPETASARPGDTAPSPANALPPPNPNAPGKSAAETLAAVRAELDRLERQARDGKPVDDRKWVAELTAAEDAARAVERESLDRLARMEARLKQLEPLARSPDFKDGPGRDAAASLASGDLARAEKSLGELAKAAAEEPNDPQLRKQVEQLRDELRKAAENRAARDKLEKLIEQAKSDGRDPSGLEQERDRLASEAKQSRPLSDVADQLDAASRELRQGSSGPAAKELGAAAEKVRAIGEQAKAAGEAQAQIRRIEQLRAGAGKSGGTGGLSDPRPPSNADPTATKDVGPRVPFLDPKGPVTRAGSGNLGGGFAPTDPAKLGPAIQQAAQSAAASVAGQPLGRDDRDAVREFFERLGK